MKLPLSLCAVAVVLSAAACAPKNGKNGTNGAFCSTATNTDGSATVTCTNGTTATIDRGATGATGAQGATGTSGATAGSCALTDNGDGTAIVTCPGSGVTVSDGHGPCVTLAGDLNVSSELDIAAFQAAGCTVIDGSLNITSGDWYPGVGVTAQSRIADLSGLSRLTTITGNLIILGLATVEAQDPPGDPLQFTSLHGLENLAQVGGTVLIDGEDWLRDVNLPLLTSLSAPLEIGENYFPNNYLNSVELPALTSATSITIATNPFLASVNLGSLTSVSGNLDISSVGQTVDLGQIATVGGTVTLDHTNLSTVDLPLLASATAVVITASANVTVNLPMYASGGFTLKQTGVTDLELPVLATSGTFDIELDGSLTTIDVPDLVSINDLTVERIPATALTFAALTTITDKVVIELNDNLSSLTFPAGPVAVTTSAALDYNPDLDACDAVAAFTGVTPTTAGDAACPQ